MATWILLLSITSLATSAPNSASIEDIMETFTEQTARIAELTKEINDLKSLNSEQKTSGSSACKSRGNLEIILMKFSSFLFLFIFSLKKKMEMY